MAEKFGYQHTTESEREPPTEMMHEGLQYDTEHEYPRPDEIGYSRGHETMPHLSLIPALIPQESNDKEQKKESHECRAPHRPSLWHEKMEWIGQHDQDEYDTSAEE